MVQSTNKSYELQPTGGSPGAWGTVNNSLDITPIDANLGGYLAISLSQLNVVLTASQAQNLIYRLTGTLTAAVAVTIPAFGFFVVENVTTGDFAITITNGAGVTAIVPRGCVRKMASDPAYGVRPVGLKPPGSVLKYTGPNLATLASEYVLAYGQNISRTTYANLFATIGTLYGAGDGSTTFGVPDLRGRTTAGVDNMGGAAAGRITQFTGLGATGGEELHTLTIGEMPSHNHGGVTGDDSPDHTHVAPYANYVIAQGSAFYPRLKLAGGAQTSGASVRHQQTIAAQGGGAVHNTLQPTQLINYLIKT